MSIRTILIIVNVVAISIASRRFDQIEVINNNQFLNTRNALKVDEYKWPNGVIPFAFHDEWSSTEKKKVVDAMDIFNRKTCISFVRKTKAHTTYILFRKSPNRCTSTIGYRNQTEPIEIAYSNYCIRRPGAIQHEMLHVIGLVHEQCRNDRDDYIDIIWENIEEKYYYNFDKVSNTYFDTFNSPYDYHSLMHYSRNAYAKEGYNVTMVSKMDPTMELGQILGPSKTDLNKVRKMYKCT